MDILVNNKSVHFEEATLESSLENITDSLLFVVIGIYDELKRELKVGYEVAAIFNNQTIYFTIDNIEITARKNIIYALVSCQDKSVELTQTVAPKTIQFNSGSKLSTIFKGAFDIDIDTSESIGITEDVIINQGDRAYKAFNLLTLDKDNYIGANREKINFNIVDGSRGHISIDEMEALTYTEAFNIEVLPYYNGDFSKGYTMESKGNKSRYNAPKELKHVYKDMGKVGKVLTDRQTRVDNYIEVELIGYKEWISVNSSVDISTIGINNYVVWYSRLHIAHDTYSSIIKVAK